MSWKAIIGCTYFHGEYFLEPIPIKRNSSQLILIRLTAHKDFPSLFQELRYIDILLDISAMIRNLIEYPVYIIEYIF